MLSLVTFGIALLFAISLNFKKLFEVKSTYAALADCYDNSGVVVWRKSFHEDATPPTLALPILGSWAPGIYHKRVIRPLQVPQMQRL